MELLKKITYKDIYYWTLVILGISLTLSPFVTSVCQFILIITWLVEGFDKKDFKEKFSRITSNKPLLIFLSVFVIHVLGIFFAKDYAYWFKDVKIKLPLFVLPFILGSIKPISIGLYKRIIRLFIWANLIASAFSGLLIINFFGFEYNDIRYTSIIISHIRFALYITVGVIFLIDDLITGRLNFFYNKKWINVLLITWFVFYLVLMRSLTGIFSLYILLLLYLIFNWRTYNKIGFKIISVIYLGLFIAVTLMIGVAISKFLYVELPVKESLEKYTEQGNLYDHNLESKETENGNLVYLYYSEKELKKEWNERSDIDYYGVDLRDQPIRITLIRYLTSLDLRKDSSGISQLDKHDIEAIEFGYANYLYAKSLNFYSRIYQTVWEIDRYLNGGNPTYHSVTQRFEFLRTAFYIIGEHPLKGVGNANLNVAYVEAYKELNSILKKERRFRAHNQFVTFWVSFGLLIGSYIIFSLMYPVIKSFKCFSIPERLFYILAFLSMLAEDTLETQAGVMFFIFFYCIFLFSERNEHVKIGRY